MAPASWPTYDGIVCGCQEATRRPLGLGVAAEGRYNAEDVCLSVPRLDNAEHFLQLLCRAQTRATIPEGGGEMQWSRSGGWDTTGVL